MSLLNNRKALSDVYNLNLQPATLSSQLPVYVICTLLGLFGGALGVTLALGLAIIIELFLLPLALGIVPLALVAVGAGWVMVWLQSRFAVKLFHYTFAVRQMQVMFVVSTLTSLLQVFIYMQGF
jgi:hypothetical protein